MNSISDFQACLRQCAKDRDWSQFHKPKDLAISLSLEANEVLELFQWKNEEEVRDMIENDKEKLAHELVDVLAYLVQIADAADIDIWSACVTKMKLNAKKYPVEKAKGRHTKYTEL
jgi:NTP pyrophosphatase (non-canonical NTP hydrolase)